MERHTRLSRAAVVLVAIALIAAIAAAVWFASPDAPYVPNEDSGAALGAAAPAEDGTVAGGYQPSGTGISDNGTDNSAITTIRSSLASNKSYYLTDDITVTSFHTSTEWTDEYTFGKATLDGAGHTITIDAKSTGSNADVGGLFMGLRAGATIKNLTIVVEGFSFGSTSDTINVGMIAGYAAGGNITIDNVKLVLERTSGVNDPYVYKNNEGTNTAINFGGLIGKVENGTVTISNTTVINNEKGTYGFSARNHVKQGSDSWIGGYDSNSWTNVGGFVGSVQADRDGHNGNLTMEYVKYDAADGAKMSAYAAASGGTRRYNYARIGAFVGVANVGELNVNNLIFNATGTFTDMFVFDSTVSSDAGDGNGRYSGRGIVVGNRISDAKVTLSGIHLRDGITDGLGTGSGKDSLLLGSDAYWAGRMSYPSEIEDASFTDDGKIAFALPNRSGDIEKAVSKINQNDKVTALTDAQIAEQVTEGGKPTWVKADIVYHGEADLSARLDTVSTGTYSVENYDAVSSADDSAYRGSKVYDGTPVNTPTLKVGGTTVNAWTAGDTTADAGTKTFSYNANALSGYATATNNGGTYLVQGGTIYSGTIIVNDEEKPFALGKDFVYEITPAPVEVVVANIQGTFYEGDSMPKLTVQSVTPDVPGTIAWNDSRLVYGQSEYGWTWTPESDNYQPDTGTVTLQVLQATINEIVVSGDFKTQYTAYDAFDPTGMVVTAYYVSDSEHERGVVLESGDYTVSVANGVNDRLLVANDTVTVSLKEDAKVNTTFKIKVSKLVVDVPTEVAGLVYNGEKQKGVDEGEHYWLSDNTGTYAANYTATAELKDKDNTEWSTGGTDNVTIPWSIAPMTLDGTVSAPDSLKYDGNAKDAAFDLTTGTLFDPDQVTIVYDADDRTNVTGEAVTATAQLPSSGNYKWATDAPSASFTVTPKPVVIGVTSDLSKTYNGQAVDPDELFTAPQGVGGGELALTVTVDGGATILNAGSYTVTAVLAQGQPNYTAKQAVAKYSVSKADPTVNPTADVQGALYTSDDLYEIALNLGEQDTPGTVSWDEGQRLTAGEQEYKWTFVPTDGVNYNGATGGIKLTAEQAQLVSVTVDVMPDTAYTAFDAFDPEGMVVTAHYPNGDTKQVALNDLSLTVDQGSINRLVVASTTVTVSYSDGGVTKSDTITIEVLPLEVAAPKAKSDLVYNGKEQRGVEEGEHYTLSGNTGTNAANYTATAELTDKANTEWEDGTTDDVLISWTIGQMTLDGTVLAAGSLEYDGKEKEAAFDLTTGTLFDPDQVTIVYGGVADRVNVTGEEFTATAQLPNNGNYKWATDAPSASFAVAPMPVVIGVTGDLSKTYDGQEVDPDELFTPPNGVDGGALTLTVTVDGGKTILNAGSYTVTAVLAQGQPNYTAEQAVAKYSVSKAKPTVNPTADVQGALYTSDDLYEIALNLGEQDTPGTVSWDEGQRLTAGEQEYKWTFVPTDGVNYNGATGGIKLTAEQAQLVSVTVDVMPDTAYTAFDAFDPEGMVVTAHYPNGDTKQVALNDLSLTVDQGSINRLVVASTTVTVSYSDGGVTKSDTITIEVSPLEVAAPKAKTDLVYNGAEQTGVEEGDHYTLSGNTGTNAGDYVATATLTDKANTVWEDGSTDDVSIAWTIREPVTSDEVIADILAMEKVTWQNAEEFLDLEARYDALDKSEQTAEATAKLEVLRAQYDALRNAAFDDIEAAHEVTAKSLGKALAAAAAGLSAAAIALAIAKRRSI